jgi:ectoine hydroxylase-related dioxygenase (phytanoyl-CoA dioxygenase family)
MFNRNEMADYERDFDEIVRQISQGGDSFNARWRGASADLYSETDAVVQHTKNVQQFSAAWLRLMLDQRFLGAAKALLGPDIILHHTKLFQKPAERGAAFPPHQDWEYFPTAKNSMLAAVVHVSEATDEMGCLRFFPGSHKLGRLKGAMNGGDLEFAKRFPMDDSIAVESEPGDVVFFHCCAMHCSRANRSARTRKTVLIQLHAGDDEVESGSVAGHVNVRMVLAGRNRLMTREQAEHYADKRFH